MEDILVEQEHLCEYATCRAACPVHTDTRGYAELVALGRYHEAFDLIRSVNPFPSVCGYVCHHPCEQECRRQHVDASVALRELKRFVADRSREYRKSHHAKADAATGKRIAVVGAGPAGLTAAKDLAVAGHVVEVYEKDDTLGGMLANAVPAYRLPDAVLGQDIEEILSLGITVHSNADVSADGLFARLVDDFDAVVLATGLPQNVMLPGLDGDGITGALEFLYAARRGDKIIDPGKTAIVIGGGNVAMDVARTARRLGADTVDIVCLENEEEIPAWPWELEEATDEGVTVHHRWGPVEPLRAADGSVTGLRGRKALSVFDDSGAFHPTYDDSDTRDFAGDSILVSIGQRSKLDFVEGILKLDGRGRLVVDRATMRTSRANVFACGEVITGPGAAIEAVASGQRAAKCIEAFLATGAVPTLEEEEFHELGELSEKVLEAVVKSDRIQPKLADPVERVKSFELVQGTYTELMARREALRCLNCTGGADVDADLCAACLTCLRVCPFDVPQVTDTALMSSDLCQACGMCAAECPAEAISMKRWPANTVPDWITAALAESPDNVVTFECLDSAVEQGADTPGTVYLPCSARLGETDVLKALEMGAARVVVRACEADQCRFSDAFPFFARRMRRAARLLAEIGLQDRFEFVTQAAQPVAAQ